MLNDIFTKKPQFEAIVRITKVGEVKTFPTQNGEFKCQDFGAEVLYGTTEKPYIETISLQATSRKTRAWDKETKTWNEAPSFIQQFSEKPLKEGAVAKITCNVSAFIGDKETEVVMIPKVTLETIWFLKNEDKNVVLALLDTAKTNRANAAAGI